MFWLSTIRRSLPRAGKGPLVLAALPL